MSHITLYLDRQTESYVRAAAKRSHLSLSKWIAKAVQGVAHDAWPDEVRQLQGAWRDFPTAEQLRAHLGADAVREQD